MPLRSVLGSELPFLRRYARCLTGSQQRADDAVRDMLVALIEAPAQFDMAAPIRLELYRTFHRLWHPEAVLERERRPSALLDLVERSALMLTTVEGFSAAEAALILDVQPERVDEASAAAGEVLARCLSALIMVIEDDPVTVAYIQQVVEEFGHSVCATAKTHAEAVAMARSARPELILADINLADGSSGVDAVQEILRAARVPVVFVTAFPDRLLTGERPEPTYLVTKPFEAQALLSTIGQAILFHREQFDMPASVPELCDPAQRPDRDGS